MNTERWPEVERVLDIVLDAPPEHWPALLDEHCGQDKALREEVRQLLAQHDRDHTLLDSGAGELAARLAYQHDSDLVADALVGTELGRWTVLQQIGRGGMSRVYLGARSDGTFEQRVAIKVLRAGLDSPADIERFRLERQVLARLAHPFIARLLDGGMTPDGRPYLVLEYVEGEPLTDFCTSRKLDIPARLRLFLSVAEALQSAHRQLVVHRDLKPTNILVSGDGRPRLLDFGIAALLDPESQSSQSATITRLRWLTPDYAAPEQFTGAAITTATDVYQLGAVLYELLCGRRVFSEPAAHVSLEHRILHEDARAPSTHAPVISADLDAILLKALRKEPDARYASVAALSADVQRALDGEPVRARDGDRMYRWQRTLRRRALPLSVAAAAVMVAAVYVRTLTVQNRRISSALTEATSQRERAEQVTDFMFGLFRVNDPTVGRGDTISARALLERGVQRAGAFSNQPEVQAELFDIIGRVHSDLGAFDEARPSFERALSIRRRMLGDSHPDVAVAMARLAQLHEHQGRHDEAVAVYREVLERQRSSLGDSATATLQTMFLLASAMHAAGARESADTMFRSWDRLASGRPLQRDLLFATQLRGMGQYWAVANAGDTARLRRAAGYLRQALAIQAELLGADEAEIAATTESLASVLWRLGERGPAEVLYRDALSTLRGAHPNGHPTLAITLSSYGRRLLEDARLAEAVSMLQEAASMTAVHYGEDHPRTPASVAEYGDALRRAGRFDEAIPLLRDAANRMQRQSGATYIYALRARAMLGDALGNLGRLAEAESLLRPTYHTLADTRGSDDVETQLALRFLVHVYEQGGRSTEAKAYRARLMPDSAR